MPISNVQRHALATLMGLSLILAPALVVAARPTAAQSATFTPEQDAAIDAANAHLNRMSHLQGAFVQTGPNGERSEGRVFIQRPGKMRFEYDRPNPMLIVADGRWVAVENRKAKTTEQYPLKLTPLRLILDETIDLRSTTRILGVETSLETTTIVVEDKDGKVPGQLALMFSNADYTLQQWTVTDAQGLNTSVALFDLVAGKKAPARLFFINQNIYPDQTGSDK